MTEDFLLNSTTAKELYSEIATLPIIDFHNHLELSNKKYENITELWISSDPYKHRLMRISGVKEYYITGKATPREKFDSFCNIFPSLAGTPVYTWCLMELSYFFKTDITPSKKSSDALWHIMNEQIIGLNSSDILKHFKIEYASPVAELTEDISKYRSLSSFAPSLRGDSIISATPSFIKTLGELTEIKITSLEDYLSAISKRLDLFSVFNCKFVDHALDDGFVYIGDDGKNAERFEKMLAGKDYNRVALSSYILKHLAQEYGKRGFVLQLHIGAIRKTSDRLLSVAGPAGGYAAIGRVEVREIVKLISDIEKICLPKTIIFPLNPSQTEEYATLSGSFSKDGINGAVTLGPAWWWCDHKYGIENTLKAISSYSVLSQFIGMTTDSRSPLSFVRHDYFRRIVCSYLASESEHGEYPKSKDELKKMLRDVCYENAKSLIKPQDL